MTAATRCTMDAHFGTVGPLWHADRKPDDDRTGWHGYCGRRTAHPSGICQPCRVEWRANYPGRALPDPLPIDAATDEPVQS